MIFARGNDNFGAKIQSYQKNIFRFKRGCVSNPENVAFNESTISEKMPSSPPDSNGQSRFNGQEVLDLGVCLQIVKKALVTIPIIIMIVLYVIRSYAHATKDSIATNSSLTVTDEDQHQQNTSNSQENSSFLDPR